MKKFCKGHGILLHIPGKNTCFQGTGESLALSHHTFFSILDNKKIQPSLK
jgi:hypothetical protein